MMRSGVRMGILLTLTAAELAICGSALAQATSGNVAGIDIIIRKKPGHANMACMYNGRPCSENVVRQVSAEASKRGVSVSLAGSDGLLRCTTRDGKECTDEAVGIVQAAGRAVATKGVSGN